MNAMRLIIFGIVFLLQCVTVDGPKAFSSIKTKASSDFKFNPILSYD